MAISTQIKRLAHFLGKNQDRDWTVYYDYKLESQIFILKNVNVQYCPIEKEIYSFGVKNKENELGWALDNTEKQHCKELGLNDILEKICEQTFLRLFDESEV